MQKLVFINGNGTQIDLTAGNFGVVNWAGLSNTSLNIQTQQVPFEDGGVFLDALMEQREIELTIAIYDGNNLALRYQKKRELISALNPKLGEGVLIYTNDYLSKQIKAVPQIPLFENKNSNDVGTLKATIVFSCPNPYWEDVNETEVEFGVGEFPVIENNGDIPTQVEIEFLTSGVTNPKITNMRNDKKIEYNGTLDKNLYINTNIGNKKAFTEDMDFNITQFNKAMRNGIFCEKLGIFIAVGGNILYTSYDGVEWEQLPIGATNGITGIIYSEEKDLFVVIGQEGLIMTSADLKNWTVCNSGLTSDLKAICYSKHLGIFVILDGMHTITSSDGINWTGVSTGLSNNCDDICYSETEQIFIAVAFDGYIFKSNNGLAWSSVTSGVSERLDTVTYSEEKGLFVAGGNNGTLIKSTNGTTWTRITTGLTATILSVYYYSNLFMAVGTGGLVYTSSNGTTWTQQNSGLSVSDVLYSVSFSEESNTFIGFGTALIIKSNDGINWTKYNYEIFKTLRSVCYSKRRNIFVAVGFEGYITTSIDGINWTKQTQTPYSDLNKIIYSEENDLFIAVGQGIIISNDGFNWEHASVEAETIVEFYDVKHFPESNLFVAVGNVYCVSSDGINWGVQDVGVQPYKYSICYSNTLNLFVMSAGVGIYTSTNLSEWTQQNTGITERVNSICFSNELKIFVCIGNAGTIATSSDGINWILQEINTDVNLREIIYSKELGLFITVGLEGIIAMSSDGVNWTLQKLYTTRDLLGVTYTSRLNEIVIVGEDGTILTSYFTEAENQIQNITSDSDMGLNLLIGDNKFRLNKSSGSVYARIKYRQKYIGV